MELISGSGVLLGGEMANGVITILGFSCGRRSFYTLCLHTKSHRVGGIIGISCMFKAVGFMPQTMNYLCVYE